jgi:hypothetical protein
MQSLGDKDFQSLIGLSREMVMQYVEHRQHYLLTCQRGRPHTLLPLDEVLFLFIYLRHYPVDILLEVLFNLAVHHAAKLRKQLLDWFYNLAKDRLRFNSSEERLKASCKIFYTTYTFVIDGSEQEVMGSDDPMIDTLFYSQKKGKHTITILLIMDLQGCIIWLSASFPGISPDLALVLKTKNEWHPKFEEIESGLGDLGFVGVKKNDVRIDTPPSNPEAPLYKDFSSVRIRIEPKFAEVKDFRCCKDVLRFCPVKKQQILDTHHKHWTVVSVLINEKHGFL